MYQYRGKVISIVDGDTVVMDIDLGFGVWLRKQKIRLSGINAPELKGETLKAAQGAKAQLASLVEGKDVLIFTEKDRKEKYGRWLGTIFIERTGEVTERLVNINQKMVISGFAKTV